MVADKGCVEYYIDAVRELYGDKVADKTVVTHRGSGWYTVKLGLSSHHGFGSSRHRKGELIKMADRLSYRAKRQRSEEASECEG